MQSMTNKMLAWLMGLLVVLGTCRYGYPAVLGRVYGEVPPAWRMDFTHMTIGQINSKLGEPDDVMSAKEYQVWSRDHWWGVEELKVLAPGCCASESRPREAYYLVHAKGFYDPVVTRRIH